MQNNKYIDYVYGKVESFAQSKHKLKILFMISFLEQSISPILPDLLIVPIAMYKKYSAFFVANFAAVSSAIGATLTYIISYYYGERVVEYFNLTESLVNFESVYTQSLFIAAIIASFTPIPDKIYTVFGGVFKVNAPILILGIYIGKFIRFYIVAYLAERYGIRSKYYINKYLRMITYILTLLIFIYLLYLYLR